MGASRVEAAVSRLSAMVAARRALSDAGSEPVLVGLFGRGIQASRTPAMHEREGRRIGLPYIYVLVDFDELGLENHDLAAMMAFVEQAGFAGVNVTYPFKQAVIAELTELSPDAAAIGAVNTVVFRDGLRTGNNTDWWGFAESFREGVPDVSMGVVAQFGAGGAGAAVAHALLTLGCQRLLLCETDHLKAEALAERLSLRWPVPIEVEVSAPNALRRATGLVNTTPVGMLKHPGVPFPVEALETRHWVADVVYFPADTQLLATARGLGCRTLPGTGMAVYQAVRAFELFTGIAPDRQAMNEHFLAAA